MDIDAELQKRIEKGIKAYLNDNEVCNAGNFNVQLSYSYEKYHEIKFGQTFQRVPSFTAALRDIHRCKGSKSYAYVDQFHVTKSSAKVRVVGNDCDYLEV